jgi:hypothetical protein
LKLLALDEVVDLSSTYQNLLITAKNNNGLCAIKDFDGKD